MVNALEMLRQEYDGYQLCLVERTIYDPGTRSTHPEYCVMVPQLNELAFSDSSLEEAAAKLLRGSPVTVLEHRDSVLD